MLKIASNTNFYIVNLPQMLIRNKLTQIFVITFVIQFLIFL